MGNTAGRYRSPNYGRGQEEAGTMQERGEGLIPTASSSTAIMPKRKVSFSCKPLHTEWITSKVLLCSTGNCIQYLVMSHNGKEAEKECIYRCNRITLVYSIS